MFLHMICDYGIGDPAFAEVVQRLKIQNPDVEVYPISVPPFSTIATGFWIAQLALNDPFSQMGIFSNTAPRKDTPEKRENNEGEKLMYAVLDNGIPIISVNAGYCFSFVRKHIKKFYEVNIENKGSQFRSRDYYPKAVVGIMMNKKEYIGKEVATEIIPHVPKNSICFVDGYGNLKTSTKVSDLPKDFKPGDRLKIKILRDVRMAVFTDGTFSVREGELSFAPGSSGLQNDRYMEVLLRGDSAYHYFGKPQVGTEFSFEKKRFF